MKKFGTRLALACVAVGVLALPSASAVAQQGAEVMYNRTYYDDAAMTVEVGFEADRCTRYGVLPGPLDGRAGPYVDETPVATCVNGKIEPY